MQEAVGVDDGFGGRVAWIRGQPDHRPADLVVPRGARFGEELLRRLGHLEREFVLVDLHERARQLVDRVVAYRRRTVSAFIARFETEVDEGLLANLDGLANHLAFAVAVATATLVERELGVDQLAPVGGEPLDAVERAIGFLTAGQRHLDAA
jgi:hypothetical protein